MSEDAEAEEDGYCEMELPTLIKQLQTVLDTYPDDGQILKELIQNAEDAEATEVKILFDGRNIQPDLDPKLLKKRRYLTAIKAPALCVYNNAQFTEKDWRGIKMLHNSVKEEEPLKVGRFGLGFKSVFHITDIPCIISGDSILFINPDQPTEKVCYTKKLQALDSYTKQILAQVLEGTFGFSKMDSTFSGSLFWFPLRGQPSKLSTTVYTEKKVVDLYDALKAEASITLLFLKSIEEVHLFKRDPNDVRKLFSLKLSSNCLESVRPNKIEFVKRVKEVKGKIPASSIQNRLMLEVDLEDESNGCDTQKWLVINYFKGGDVFLSMKELDKDASLSYCPYVGLAMPLSTVCKGQVFCFLPLPQKSENLTGLALHVNGFFALSQDRGHVKWPTASQLRNQAHTDKAIEWNKCLAYEVLPEVYCTMVQELITLCQTQNNPEFLPEKVYSLLPSLDAVDPIWQPLLTRVLHQISQVNFLYTKVSGGKWITLQESLVFEEENENCDIVSEVFLLYEKNIVLLYADLLTTLKAHCSPIREVDMSMMFEMLSTNDRYTFLSRDKKMAILLYLRDPNYLHGLQLLPVDDGTFVHFGSSETVYFCEEQSEAGMFPGAGAQLVASDIPRDVRYMLKTFAKQGSLSLALMSPSVFPSLLRRSLADQCPDEFKLPSDLFNMDWLTKIWGYISMNQVDVRETLAGVPILPDVDQLHEPEKLFIAKTVPKMTSLSDLEASALQKLGVTILRNVPYFVFDNPDIRGHIIHYPTPEGVIKTLENESIMSNITNFNEQASKEEKRALLCKISMVKSLSLASREVLRMLKMFTDTSNNDCAISAVSTLAPDEDFPVMYPEIYLKPSPEACQLALTLGAKRMSLEDVCLLTLQDMTGNSSHTQEQKIQFMDFLLSNHQDYFRKQNFKKFASAIEFLTTEGGISFFKPCQLFDKKDSDLESLFFGEDQFPDSTFITNFRSGLQLIGLKTEANLTESDMIQTCEKVAELVESGNIAKAEDKIKTVFKVLNRKQFNRNLLSPLKDCCCIPRMKERPRTYPQDLPFQSDSDSMFLKPLDLCSSHYLPLVGSVLPVAVELSDTVEEVFGVGRLPTAGQVLQHFRNITRSFRSEDNRIIEGVLHEIYKFLTSAKDLCCQDIELMQSIDSVWTENGFKKPSHVYLDETGKDLNLKPYRFPLPRAMQEWKSLMLKIGSHPKQTNDMLGMVLREIKHKHDDLKSSKEADSSEAQRDLQLIIQIIGVLKDLPKDKRPHEIYLPTHQKHTNFLVLLPVSECTFFNADWLRIMTSDETPMFGDAINYVHADISESTARQLGVSSLTDRVNDDLDMEYKQNEPLTTRLKNILREYTDGFSVPKELIQNADDAGATEVCFMYDERQNLNARTFLMHAGMSSLQGPAFWAFNNAKFEKSDFANIKKISGATKEGDATKVGKFGLGFNSVYNLTDVPSFISENTVAIFDPHETYLGRGGLRANLKSEKNEMVMKDLHGQFKPFEGVFGCNFRGDTICNGTLFRFPLRTEEQASCSKIKELSYSKSEMEEFFQKFLDGCGNLILFTQNVKSVKFFHLAKDCDPSSSTLLVHVTKDVISKQVQSPFQQQDIRNVLQFINEQRKEHSNNDSVIKIKERTIVKQDIFDTELTRNIDTLADIGSKELHWDLTWATGNKESSVFASSGKLKGLVPLAGVAVALQNEEEEEEVKIFNIENSPKGFYSEGHLFCFLPLPIKSNLPVHINAGFALTPDRRQLCTMTEDDKTLLEAQWNECLIADAVSRAYVLALTDAPILRQEDVAQYYELWPISAKDHPHLVEGFYKIVIEEVEDIFVFQKGDGLDRSSFGKVRYLDPQLCRDIDVGDVAFKAAEHFWNNEAEHLAKIPQTILKCFEDAGFTDQIKSRCLDELEFFQKIFFPHIADPYWCAEERNKLTTFALDSKCPEVLELVKNVRCIPTIPSGTLKQPCDIVDQKGRCGRLFEEDDECFVYEDKNFGFSAPERLKVLCDLGMIKDDLPDEVLIERATAVSLLHTDDPKRGKQRFINILDYLSDVGYSGETKQSSNNFSRYPDLVKQQLQNIKFVPILQRPSDWKLPWKADNLKKTLTSASELFSKDAANLAGSSKLIIDDGGLEISSHMTDVLCQLGLNQKCDLDEDVVVSQLEQFAAYVKKNQEWGQEKAASDMCHQLYYQLNEMCRKASDEEQTKISELINSRFGQTEVILTGGKMVYAGQVAFELKHELSPYLFKMERLHMKYRDFFETLGVRKTFGIDDILKTINTIQEATGSGKLSKDDLGFFSRLMPFLLEIMEPDCSLVHDIDSVYLPDEQGYLLKASQLCINDCKTIEDDHETMKFVHPFINERVASWFGVKGKRETDLNKDITSFGQDEKLASRLNRIMSGYPCDASVMKELLQNADDANASELMFIKDFRTLPSETVVSERWKELQGPALCVYNNSYFSEKDFAGVQNLGEGSKRDDPLKTGQYGVGFNAVYHLTDVPSFMTVGPNTEKTVCILDPHTKYVPWASKKHPGGQIANIDEKRKKYKDFIAGYLEDCVPLKEKGTLFRFPLRTEAMAEESDISQHEISTKEVEKLLEDFKTEMFNSLLFLHSVKKITIAHVTEDERLVKEYWVESEISEADSEKQTKYLADIVTEVQCIKAHKSGLGIHDISPKEIQLTVSVKDSETAKQDWLIMHRFGFSSDKPLPESIKTAWEDGYIGLLPRGGVAVPLPSDFQNQAHKFKGKAFCILPLPIETGLPLHVNGHFVLDHEARRNLWNGTDDYRNDWNKYTMESILIPTYISALQELKDRLECTQTLRLDVLEERIHLYYGFFPRVSSLPNLFWRTLSECFYTELVNHNTDLFPVIKPATGKFGDHVKNRKTIQQKVTWVPLSVTSGFPGHFNNLTTYYPIQKPKLNPKQFVNPGKVSDSEDAIAKRKNQMELLTEILRDLGMKIIVAPDCIYKYFVEAGLGERVRVTSPKYVMLFLKSHDMKSNDKCMIGQLPKNIKDTPLKTITTANQIIDFIAKWENFSSDICGLPLAVTMSKMLMVFKSPHQLIVSRYSDLLERIPGLVVHHDLTKFFIDHASESASLRPLTLELLTELMPQLLHSHTFNCGTQISWDPQHSPSKHWIRRIWHFFDQILSKESKELKIEKSDQWIRSQLQALQSWSLFPAYCGTSKKRFLYPLTETAKVFNLGSIITMPDILKVFQKLNLHFVDSCLWMEEEVWYSNDLPLLLTASWDRPCSILDILCEFDWGKKPLTKSDSRLLLQYLSRNMKALCSVDPDAADRVLSLPFYPDIMGNLVPMKSAYLVRNADDLQTEGLEEFMRETGIKLIQHDFHLEDLYTSTKITSYTITQVYSKWLIPEFVHIPSASRSRHIMYIRKKLLMKSDEYMEEQKQLINQLERLSFIQTSDGASHRACEFYSKQNTVFSMMCPATAFPPEPYDDDDWHDFLVLLGLQEIVTVDHFVEFAKEVEKLGSGGISTEVEKKSKVLCFHLSTRQELPQERILQRIKHIRFVLPYPVRHHYDGKELLEIRPQLEDARFLICYSQSVSYKHCLTVWSTCQMFGEETDPAEWKNIQKQMAYSQLQIHQTPKEDMVAEHLQNICTSISEKQRKCPLHDQPMVGVLIKVLTQIYKYFEIQGVSESQKERLSSVKLVFIVDKGILVPASHVVTSLPAREEIDGYIYSGPEHFGPFFKLFHQFGADKTVSSRHFAHVLNKLHDKVGHEEMEPNELKVAKLAVNFMFQYLEKEQNAKELSCWTELYLPSRSRKMIKSKEMVLSNNKYFEERASLLSLQFFIGFKEIEIENVIDPVGKIKLLPKALRPQKLTKIVQEELTQESRKKAFQGLLCEEMRKVIGTPEFRSGLVRLTNHSRHQKGKESLNMSECEKIEEDLKNLEIYEVKHLEVWLRYKGENVQNSKASKHCYVDTLKSGVRFFLSTRSESTGKSQIYNQLVFAISKLTKHSLGEDTVHLAEMLKMPPEEICDFLDSLQVREFEYQSKFDSRPYFPPPGTVIPERFHFMLDNSFGYFRQGEYAGYEVYDENIDKDIKGEQELRKGVFVIYVKIEEVKTIGESPLMGRYVIQGRGDDTEEVSAIYLYKFIRDKLHLSSDLVLRGHQDEFEEDEAPKDMKSVLAEIRKILQDAWQYLKCEKERNRVRKRLYFKWHPDKNLDRKDFCVEICKHIAIYVHRLENGRDLDVGDGDSWEESTPEFTWCEQFGGRFKRQANYQRDYEEEQRRSGRGGPSFHESARSEPNPQEARRWFRQGHADLDAATERLGNSTACNWICFMCQQAAEKALKALLYTTDGRQADWTRTHVLHSIISEVDHPRLSGLVSRLEGIIQDYNRLRYPDRFTYPTIPADVFTETQASEACSLAGEILSLVEESLQ